MEEIRTGKARDIPALVTALLGILWLGVFPLACDFTYEHITEAKWVAMWIGIGLSVPAAAFGLGWQRARGEARVRLLAPILALALLGWMTVTAFEGSWADTLNAEGRRVTLWGDLRFEGVIAQAGYTLVFLCLCLAPVRLKPVAIAAAAALALFTGLCAWQYTDTNPLGFFPEGFGIIPNYEFQGTIGNIDMVVGYLALAVPLTLLPWLLRGGVGRGFVAAAGLGGVALFFFTEVQAGYVALLAFAAAMLYFFLTRPDCRGRAILLLGAMAGALLLRKCVLLPWLDASDRLCPDWYFGSLKIALLLLLLAVLAVALLPVPRSMGGLWEIHETLQGRGQDSFGSERLGVWRIAWDMALDHPIVGIGPDTFNVAAEGYLADAFMVLEQSFDTPHNLFLGYLYGSGFPGLILYLALLAAVLHRCRRGGETGAVLAAALLCYLAQGCFTFSICIISPMAWAVMGMAAALAPKENAESSARSETNDPGVSGEAAGPDGPAAELPHDPADCADGGPALPGGESGDDHGPVPLPGPDHPDE